MAGLDHVRVEPEPVAVGRRVELDLLHVEAEGVQPVQPLVELEPLVGAERLLACELAPERLVAGDHVGSGLVRVEVRG